MTSLAMADSLLGADIWNLITSSMYVDPLAIYREYLQNSADAARLNISPSRVRVDISLDVTNSRLRIRDNGPGLDHLAAVRSLLPISRSEKTPGVDRGFRGIGRLSGLAFAERVTFVTRASARDKVTRVVWDGSKIRRHTKDSPSIEDAIRKCVDVSILSTPDVKYPDHFFDVEVSGIGRYVAGDLLNREFVQAYIAEICPVPFSGDFTLSRPIIDLLSQKGHSLFTLDVFIDKEELPVVRRHSMSIEFSDKRADYFRSLERIEIPSIDRSEPAVIGWLAHSSYLGAIPKRLGIRGIRARIGNIQIGDEYIFDRLFPEERFNRWCVGEVHILDNRIIPNGRRDYFELNPHLRNLENHLTVAIRKLIAVCRRSSLTRNRGKQVASVIDYLQDTYDLVKLGYLSADLNRSLVDQALCHSKEFREKLFSFSHAVIKSIDFSELDLMESKLRTLDADADESVSMGVSESELTAYRKVFRAIVETTPSPAAAKKIIEDVIRRVREF